VQKRLFDVGRGVVHTVREASELESALQTFVELHQLRWSNLGEPGCFASREFHGFIHDCAVDLLAAGMLNLCWLEIDKKPVAAEFLLSTPDTLYVYQGGMDPASRKDSPGHALMSTIFREAIAADCRHADFLRGDEPYKAAWGARPFAAERIRIAPSRWRPQLRNQAWFAGQVMKSWVKQGLSLAGVQ